MSLPVAGRESTCLFHAYMADPQEKVKAAFNYRIARARPDDNLTIKLIDSQQDRQTYELFQEQTESDMDSLERCRLTLFSSLAISSGDGGNKIIIKPERHSWFAEAGNVAIRTPDGREKPVGTLMLVNSGNVKLLRERKIGSTDLWQYLPGFSSVPFEPDGQILEASLHQLLEMLPATDRQPYLSQCRIRGLPQSAAMVSDPLLRQWPLLKPLGNPYVETVVPATVSGMLNDMIMVADTIASMHGRGLAHGDIRLSKLRSVDGWLGPGSAERFSVVSETPGPDRLGQKRFIFYNNAWQAPEQRFPGAFNHRTKGFAPWQYTAATREGDIWSLGMLLAIMVCRIPGGAEALKNAGVLQLSLSDYMKSSGLYNVKQLERAIVDEQARISAQGGARYLTNKNSLLALNGPSGLPSIPASAEGKVKLAHLVVLVQDCTDPDPSVRPSAGVVKNRLYELSSCGAEVEYFWSLGQLLRQ